MIKRMLTLQGGRKLTVICGDVADIADIPGITNVLGCDLIVSSPPYKSKDGYSDALMASVSALAASTLKDGCRAFINFGQLSEDFSRPQRVQQCLSEKLYQSQTIIWLKSVVIPSDTRHQIGHFQPIQSRRLLNYCWEYVFTFVQGRRGNPLDRLAVGVPYADKSNLKRGSRGKHGDIHCAGDVWFIPYSTKGRTKKKAHRYEFPSELVERCIKVSGLKPGSTVMDPFGGSGVTAFTALSQGHNAIIIEKDPDLCDDIIERAEREGRGNDRQPGGS